MPKVLVIGRGFHPDGKETANDIFVGLKQTGKFREDEIFLTHYKNLLFDLSGEKVSISDTKNNFELSEYNSVLMTNWFSHASVRKDIGYCLGIYFKHFGVNFFNTEAFHNRSSSKLSQMMLAALNGIAIPRTVFSLSFETLQNHAASNLGLPFVLKDAQGSRGKGNHLIKALDELEPLKNSHTEKTPFIAQAYIDSGKTDYRYFMAGGATRLVIKRSSVGDSHLTNTSAGGESELVEANVLGQAGQDMASKASQLMHREVTGVDIMVDKNTQKLYFLEANPIPQIATGSNPSKKLEALADALMEAAQGE